MADVNETLVREAIRRAEEAARAAKAEETAEEAKEADSDPKAEEAGETQQPDENLTDNEPGAAAEDETDTAEEDTEETEEPGDGGGDAEGGKERKKLFGKKNKKDPRDEKIAELNDKLLRNLAEFENFRKRTDKEKSQMFEIGARSIIEKILPAIDSFERGLSSISEEDKASPVAEGMEKIYRQLLTSLEDAGLKKIEAVGNEFDPNLHNAVMHEENEELGENIVSEEFQKGYTYHDSVVRHSMVKVAN